MMWMLLAIILLLFQSCRLLRTVTRNQVAQAQQFGMILTELRKRG